MIDFHAHLLPAADHGTPDTATSCAQLALLASCGVTHAVATPHFYPDRDTVDAFLRRRAAAKKALSLHIAEYPITVYTGAEVLITEGIDRMAGLDALCIEGTNVLLLEMPFFPWSCALFDTVERLCRKDLQIVLAHVCRYKSEDVMRLTACGALAQVNAEAYGMRGTPALATRLLREGRLAALGSDIHLPRHCQKRRLLRACRAYQSEAYASVRAASERLLLTATPLVPSYDLERAVHEDQIYN